MRIGPVDNSISYQTPYVNKVEDQQNQPVSAVDNMNDTSKTESSMTADPLNEPHDEYIPSDEQSENSAGIYQLKQDEDGQKKIVFDRTDSTEKKGEQPEVNPEPSADPSSDSDQPEGVDGTKGSDEEESKCTTNTDKVDREIKKLKEEKKQIEQELKSNQNDEDKRKDLEQQLTQVESELSMKDNDAYRKQNATYTYG